MPRPRGPALKSSTRTPRLLLAAAISLTIGAALAIAGFIFDTWQVTAYRMDDMIGWSCLFAAVAIVLAIVHRLRAGDSALAGQRRVVLAIIALGVIPILIVAGILALLIAL